MTLSRGSAAARHALVGALLFAALQPCSATSLSDAIGLAYETNPALRSQQAQVRAIDEGYVQARAGYGPQVGISGQLTYEHAAIDQPAGLSGSSNTAHFHAATGSADLSLAQPIYSAGEIRAQVRSASAEVMAARQELRQGESQLLEKVITAYVDVRRDREIIGVIKDEIAALKREFDEIRAKGILGASSKTDVAQSEARLLSAQSQLNLALGSLSVSNAEYLNVVGQNPGELDPEPELAGLPTSVNEAFDSADRDNARLLAAVESEKAARERVSQSKASFGPHVSLKLDAALNPVEPYLPGLYDRSVTAALVFSKPLFSSGAHSSRVREALERDTSALLDTESARRDVTELVARAWNNLSATRSAIEIQQDQLDAESIAVKGNRVEERVGLRTTIDMLNAELELADTRINLARLRHDKYIAGADLLSAMGRLEAQFLIPSAQLYHPEASFDRVRNKGSIPWEGAVEALDSVGAPARRQPDADLRNTPAKQPEVLPYTLSFDLPSLPYDKPLLSYDISSEMSAKVTP
jgi:outer membrane protein